MKAKVDKNQLHALVLNELLKRSINNFSYCKKCKLYIIMA